MIARSIDCFGNHIHFAKYSTEISMEVRPPWIRDHSPTSFRAENKMVVQGEVR
jgi:hypothetical protein